MPQQIVTIIGGTGFVGRYTVKLLAASGYTIRVIARRPDNALHLKTAGDVGQIVLMSGNVAEPESLAGKLDDSYAVINLAGILAESGRQRFSAVHAQGAEALARMARNAGAQRFVHVSALGVEQAEGSHYARSKLLGEKAVIAAFPEATILRPSVIFGPEDQFFNRFAAMACLSPALPLIGGGHTRLQPVYAGDVAKAILASLTRADAMKHAFELAGPHIYTLREAIAYVLRVIERKRPLVNIPFGLASLIAPLAQFKPYPFTLTPDQVSLLKTDNVAAPDAPGLHQLGIAPAAVEIIVPGYLARFNKKLALKSGFDRVTA